MSRMQQTLIRQARQTYSRIYPCAFKRSLEECFTVVGNKYVLWFNTEDNSTRIVSCDLSEPEAALLLQ